MNKTHVVTARIDAALLTDLDRLASEQDRSRSWLVAAAVERYVREEIAFHDFLKEGEDAIDRGDFVTHEELVAEIQAMKAQKAAA